VRRACGQGVVSVRRLPGASSSAVHALTLRDGRRLALRRYVWDKVLREEPEMPAREVAAVHYAGRHGIVVPAIVAADLDGLETGDGVPVILTEYVPGQPRASPDSIRLAAAAAAVHRLSGAGFSYRYEPWCRATSTRPPEGCRDPGTWRHALEIWHGVEPAYEPRFIHRDFHPGNVLWPRHDQPVIVDWANACVGPPGVDIATCRWNLADWAGESVADAFVAAYEEVTGVGHEPFWDIAGILEDDWDLIDDPGRVAAAEAFLGGALRRWQRFG
jgi:Ser/Thr protein kinase RdoA (MazF antagonist)